MFKGKILKFSGTYAIVCSDTLSYEKIKLKPQMEIGQTIYYFEEDIIQSPKVETTSIFSRIGNISFAYKVAPLMMVLLLAVMVFNHQQISPTSIPAYGVVSIDINPSLSLLIDETGLVEDAEGKNSDGQDLLESLKLIDLPLQSALEEIIAASESAGYLKKRQQIFIATTEYSDTHTVRGIIEQALESSSLDDPYTVYVAEVDYGLYELAQEENVSIGHYYLEASSGETEEDLFNTDTIEKILLEDNGAIQLHLPQKTRLDQEEKHLEQEEHKQDILDKQEEKHLEQEEHKQDTLDKQEEKRLEQEERKQDTLNKEKEPKQDISNQESQDTPKNIPASSNKTDDKNANGPANDNTEKDADKLTGQDKEKSSDDKKDTSPSKNVDEDKEEVDNEASTSDDKTSKPESTNKENSSDDKAEKSNNGKKK